MGVHGVMCVGKHLTWMRGQRVSWKPSQSFGKSSSLVDKYELFRVLSSILIAFEFNLSSELLQRNRKVQILLVHFCVRLGNLICFIFLSIPYDSDAQPVLETTLLSLTLSSDIVNLVYILGRYIEERGVLKMCEISDMLLVSFSYSIIRREKEE